ncbi:hypothetical protein JQ615_39345 [Bradyrhizobium jicamae]|uniref:Uncharacterized protein n=1 Tax=Bradyrhizobium jicamae TaxID=280332 RepID=A0ABS5FX83_9BRAD|nr:hypothetical protein [Bradyrhizobium jicamae]MBR0801420.1 hypothetical protein [Bradyrhizobium jicamae]
MQRIVLEGDAFEANDSSSADIKKATDEAMFASDAAANELLSVTPTTLAGILALLRHATEFDGDGIQFPDRVHDEERDIIRSWQFFLIEHAAAALADRVAA